MNRFERLKMTLFDSTNANFKLEVEAQFTRGNRDTGFRDIVYTTDRYTGILNPNIYLTFAYRSEEVSPLYTSYPQLFRIREAFEKVKNWVADGSGFMTADGVLCVRGNCDEPVVVTGIGKNNNWISLKLVAAETDEDGIVKVTPCVAIELSSSNRLTSILSAEEFLTVYTIIRDLNLSTLQCMMSLGFLNVDKQNNPYYQQPAQPQMMNNGWSNNTPQNYPQQPPMNGNWAGGGATTPGGYGNAPARPRYNNQSYRNAPTRQVPPPPSGSVSGRSVVTAPQVNNSYNDNSGWPTDSNPYPDVSQPRQNTNNSALPSRPAGGSIMNMKAVEETPISEIDYDDTSAIDAIFNEDN